MNFQIASLHCVFAAAAVPPLFNACWKSDTTAVLEEDELPGVGVTRT
jgi:hypothetical protein